MACSRESTEKDTKLESEIKEEFLSCKICYEPFTNPKSLTCLHTFCEKCLEAHLATIRTYKYSDHKEFPCPMCRKRTALPTGGVRALPDNFLIGSLNELVGRQRVTKLPFCEVCKLVNKKVQEAKSKCIECNKLMCKPCVDKHAKTKITASHNMFDIDIEKDIGCKVHPEEMVKYFCENCETCICVLCTFQEHAEHDLLSFQEGVSKYKGDMYRLLNKCKSMITGYTKIAESLQKTEDMIKVTEKEIKDTSHAFVAAIRAKEKQMIDELHNVYGEEVMDFIAKRADIDLTLNNLSSTTRLADVIMKGSPMEMLLLKKDVQDKLEDLAELCPPTLPDEMNKKVMFIQGSVLLGSLESGSAQKTLTAFMDKRPRNREVQTDPMWIHDLTDECGEPVASSIKIKYVERYQEETQTDDVDMQHMWSQTKDDLETDNVWCQTGEDDFGFFDDQALWYYDEKAWYQKDLEDESVQTEHVEQMPDKSDIINSLDENELKFILNEKFNYDDKPKMVDTGTQIEELKKVEMKAVQAMIIGEPLKSQPKHKNIQVALVGDPLGTKPKQFKDQFSQCERTILRDSEAQVTEVGDPLWVTPKAFADAWVQKDMDPHEVGPKTVPSVNEGSSVAPPKEVTSTKMSTIKADSNISEASKESKSQPPQQKQLGTTNGKTVKRIVKSQPQQADTVQTQKGKQELVKSMSDETRQPLSEAEAFKQAREEMVQAAKLLLDPNMVETAIIELEKQSSDSDEMHSFPDTMTSSINSDISQPINSIQASQTNTSSPVGPMQAYGPINIPPGTLIRRVQNLPAGAVPIDPSMLPPGMIPMHAKTNPNALQNVTKPMADNTAQAQEKTRTISEDSGDESFVQKLRPASSSETIDSDATSDSDEKEVEIHQPSNVAARKAAIAATAQQQKYNQAKRITLSDAPHKQKQILERNQRENEKPPKSAAVDNSNGKRQKRRQQKGKGRDAATPKSNVVVVEQRKKIIPLKVETEVGRSEKSVAEPLKRAISSDLIPVEDRRREKQATTDTNNDQLNAFLANSQNLSIMDDGWGV